MNTSTTINTPIRDSRSIAAVVKDYSKKLFGFIRGKVKTVEDAEDILQEVWYQFSNLTNIEDIESVSGWLHQTARNKVIDRYRKKSTRSIEDFEEMNEDGELHVREILLLDESENPDLAMFKDLFWQELMKALEELPEKQRAVFISNEMEDQTLQEIADSTGENLKTIISRKGYAVKHLRNRLNYLYEEFLNG